MQFVVGNRNAEARAEHLQLVFVQLFLLVSDVLAFTGFAQPVALNRLGEDDRRAPGVSTAAGYAACTLIGSCPPRRMRRKLIVGKMLDHLQQARIAAEKVLAEISAAFDEIFLILPVADFAQPLHQQSVAIVLN